MSAVVRLDSRRPSAAPVPAVIAPGDRILRIKAVVERSGLSRATIYRRIALGQFPSQADLGGGSAVGWRESDIATWIANRGQGGRA